MRPNDAMARAIAELFAPKPVANEQVNETMRGFLPAIAAPVPANPSKAT